MKKTFKIDAALYPAGVLTILSGFCLHIAGHGGNAHACAVWAYVHTLISVVMTCLVAWHLFTHKAWVRSLGKGALERRQRITCVLGIIALLAMLSGLAVLVFSHANTHVGMLHYRLSILFTLFAIGHAAKRFGILRKALGK